MPAAHADIELPAEYEHAIYVGHPANADLAGFTPTDAWHHYQLHGEREGRLGNRIDGRGAFQALVPAGAAILEIGPLCIPAFARPAHDVRFLDAFDTAALRREVARHSWGAPEKVPEIDYVWRGEAYRALTGRDFDVVYSSHNIEHQPCLVTHLCDVGSVLRPGGRLLLIVPDRRYCFDHFLPDSTIADALDAHAAGRRVHSLRNIINHRVMLCHNDPDRHWLGDHGTDPATRPIELERIRALRDCLAEYRSAADGGPSPYIDAHAWQFTPASFRHVMNTLSAMGLIPLMLERLYPTLRPANEFHAVLRRQN